MAKSDDKQSPWHNQPHRVPQAPTYTCANFVNAIYCIVIIIADWCLVHNRPGTYPGIMMAVNNRLSGDHQGRIERQLAIICTCSCMWTMQSTACIVYVMCGWMGGWMLGSLELVTWWSAAGTCSCVSWDTQPHTLWDLQACKTDIYDIFSYGWCSMKRLIHAFSLV